MTATSEWPPAPGRRLPSIFDEFPVGTPVTLDALEVAMAADAERRTLAALDRALANLAALAGSTAHQSAAPPRRPRCD